MFLFRLLIYCILFRNIVGFCWACFPPNHMAKEIDKTKVSFILILVLVVVFVIFIVVVLVSSCRGRPCGRPRPPPSSVLDVVMIITATKANSQCLQHEDNQIIWPETASWTPTKGSCCTKITKFMKGTGRTIDMRCIIRICDCCQVTPGTQPFSMQLQRVLPFSCSGLQWQCSFRTFQNIPVAIRGARITNST